MDGKIEYLNTDLDVKSAVDLKSLSAALEAADLIPLHQVVEGNDLNYASFESSGQDDEPEPDIAAMLSVVENLAPPLQAAWNGCTQREFNIGFECGDEPWAFNQGLSNELIRRIAAAGATLRITLYPHRQTAK